MLLLSSLESKGHVSSLLSQSSVQRIISNIYNYITGTKGRNENQELHDLIKTVLMGKDGKSSISFSKVPNITRFFGDLAVEIKTNIGNMLNLDFSKRIKEISFSLMEDFIKEDPNVDAYFRQLGIFITSFGWMNSTFEEFFNERREKIAEEAEKKGKEEEKRDLDNIDDEIIKDFFSTT